MIKNITSIKMSTYGSHNTPWPLIQKSFKQLFHRALMKFTPMPFYDTPRGKSTPP